MEQPDSGSSVPAEQPAVDGAEQQQPTVTPPVEQPAPETETPEEESTPDAKEATADPDYDLTTAVPEHVPPHLRDDPATVTALEEVGAMAKEAGIPAKTARLMTGLYAELAMEMKGQIPEIALHDQGNMENYLQNLWGPSYEGTVKAAQEAARSLGPKFLHWLGETGLGNDPAMLITLAGLAKDGAFRTMTPVQAREAVKAMRADKLNPINTQGATGRTPWMMRHRLLSALANSDDTPSRPIGPRGDEGKISLDRMVQQRSAKAPMADSHRGKLEEELRSIRQTPAYYKGGPEQKALAARLRAIYAELYPPEKD